jgi:peptidoglycan/LPS O-acetylase OafA/YrhL
MEQKKDFEPKHLAYIDTLRGLAFLGVLCTHAAGCVGHFPLMGLFLSGGYGVELFFLASAVTLCYSASKRSKIDRYPWLSFFIRRFFRIAPLFWLAMVFYWTCPHTWPELMHQTGPDSGIQPYYFVLTGLFLHGWLPETLNSIVPGGWSIAVEMTFYVLFPLCFYYINSLRKAVVAILVSFVFVRVILSVVLPILRHHVYAYAQKDDVWFFNEHWFPSQAPVFLIGFGTFYFLRSTAGTNLTRSPFWSNAIFVFCFMAFTSLLFDPPGFIPSFLIGAIILAGFVVAISSNAIPYLVNPVVGYIGTISYSCYLVHFAVLVAVLRLFGLSLAIHVHDAGSSLQNLLLFAKIISVTGVLTIVCASVTYHLIEKPGIAAGRQIIHWLNRPRLESAYAKKAVAN